MIPNLPQIANPSQQRPKRNKNSFHEKEKQYWIEVENLRLVRKLYKIDVSSNNYPSAHLDTKPSSYMLKQEKEKRRIFAENQRMFERISRKTSSHYSKYVRALYYSHFIKYLCRNDQMTQFVQHKKWVTMLSNNYHHQKEKEEHSQTNGGARRLINALKQSSS